MSGFRFSRVGALAIAAALAMLFPPAPPALAARHSHHKAAEEPAKPPPAGVELLGKADAWSAYASKDSNGRVCYLAGDPRKSEPAGFARKTVMAMVTHRPAENISNVVSFVEGYPLKPGSSVVIEVGGRRFELFTKDDSAWASTSELDRTIVGELDRSKIVVARGQPMHGPATVDIYSLAGFPQALALIDKACGVQREQEHPGQAVAAAKPTHPLHHHSRHRPPSHEAHP
jgi:hypothetical protein